MKWAAFTIALLFTGPSYGQFYYANYQAYSARDSFVRNENSGRICKDKSGFLWIASDNGLYRFDGQNFKAYRCTPGQKNTVPSNNVIFLYQDRKGRYWVSFAQKGLYLFNPASEEFYPWHPKNRNLPASLSVGFLFEDRQGNIWGSLSYSGIGLLNTADTTLQVYPTCSGKDFNYFSTAVVNDMIELSNGHFLIASNRGLVEFDPANGKQTVYTDDTWPLLSPQYNVNTLTSILKDRENNIWCGSWGGGLRKFDWQTKKFTAYQWSPGEVIGTRNIVTAIIDKGDDALWIAAPDAGLMVFDKRKEKFLKIKSPSGETKNVISANNCLLDDEDILWALTSDGLVKINPMENLFPWISLSDNAGIKTFVADVNNFAHLPGDSMYYVGCLYGKGFFSYNAQNGQKLCYANIGNGEHVSDVNDLLFDSRRRLWVCSSTGVWLFDTGKKMFIPTPLHTIGHFNDRQEFTAIIQATDGTYWLGTDTDGLYHYDPANASIVHYCTAAEPGKKLPYNVILTLFEDRQGNVWFGFAKDYAIACISRESRQVVAYNAGNGFPAGNCRSICQSKEGKILYVLKGIGLCALENPFSPRAKTRIYNSSDGLPTDRIVSLFRDYDGYIWMSTARGLLKCESSSMKWIQYTPYDGLERNLTFSNFFQDEQGKMYIGYHNGFHIFDPQQLRQRDILPKKVVIHSFTVNGKEFKGDIAALKELHLRYNESPISFEFAALTFTDNPFIQYAYKLEGLDNDWIYTGTRRYASYSSLKGGNYVLRIKVANRNGSWNENAFRLAMIIHPPLWETWWFRILVIFMLASAAYLWIRKRIQRIRKESLLKQLRAEAEMKALRAQMNPHFIFNCLNTIDAYIHQNNTEEASGFLYKFSQLIRAILDNSQYPFISLQKDMAALQLYIVLEEQRHNHKFTHHLEIPETILRKGYKIPPLIVQPYVENAILHGLRTKEGPGILKVSFSEREECLCCTIEDNGIGRKAAAAMHAEKRIHRHQSMGLKVSSERLAAMNYLHQVSSSIEIVDKNSNGETGVIVHLFLPKIS